MGADGDDGDGRRPSSVELVPARDAEDASGDEDEESAPLVPTRGGGGGGDGDGDGDGVPEEARGSLSPRARGMAIYLLGVFFASLTALSVRLMHDAGVPVDVVLLLRAIAGLALCALGLRARAVEHPLGRRRGVLVARGVVGMAAIYCFFATAAYLPLADASVPSFVSPLVTTIGAAAVLRERVPAIVWAAFPVCGVGALLVIQPSFLFGSDARSLRAVGVGFGAAQALFGGASKLFIRVLSGGLNARGGGTHSHSQSRSRSEAFAAAAPGNIQKEHPLTIMLYTNAVCLVGMSLLVMTTPSAPHIHKSTATGAYLMFLWISCTLTGFGGQLCVTAALGLTSASSVMPMHYTSAVYAAGAGYFILGETIGWTEGFGIALVMAGSFAASAAAYREGEEEKKKTAAAAAVK